MTLIRRTVISITAALAVVGLAAGLFREQPDPYDRLQVLIHLIVLPFAGSRGDNSDGSFWMAVAASFAAWCCLFFILIPTLALALRWTKGMFVEKSSRGRVVRISAAAVALGVAFLGVRRGLELIATNGSPYLDTRAPKFFGYILPNRFYLFNLTGEELSVKINLDGRPLWEGMLPAHKEPPSLYSVNVVENGEMGLGPYVRREFPFDLRTRQIQVDETNPEKRQWTFTLKRFWPNAFGYFGHFMIRVSRGGTNLTVGTFLHD